MPVPPDLLAAARRYQTSAAASLLESYYPLAHRLSHALCGDAKLGERTTAQVINRALTVLPRWHDETLPDRWFYHHTVLAARAMQKTIDLSALLQDPLIPTVAAAPYVAFIRTMRALPAQQREVIILHYGERLNARYLGVAMDCSADAASSHLIAATGALGQLNGEQFDALAREMGKVYQAISPTPTAVAALRGRVAQYIWPRRIWRWIYRTATVAILLGIAAIAWQYRNLLHFPTTSPTLR